MDTVKTLLNTLKRKHLIDDVNKAQNSVLTEHVTLKMPTDLFIRDAITGLGTILKEDLENHYYITSIRTGTLGNVLSYAIIMRTDNSAEISIYAREGLIKRGLAKKAMDRIVGVLR